MKKAKKVVSDPDMRAEYDFAAMKGAVRGKYAGRLAGQVVAVLLAPDVAPFFRTSESVNAALRAVMAAADRGSARPRRRTTDAR